MKKTLAAILAGTMVLGLLPASALAATAQVVLAPTYVYHNVYDFDANNQAEVWVDYENSNTVSMVNDKLVASGGAAYKCFYDDSTGNYLYGYHDAAGNVAIPATYSSLAPFVLSADDTFYWGKENGVWHAKNLNGTVITDGYASMYPLRNDMDCTEDYAHPIVGNNDGLGVLDVASNTLVVPIAYSDIYTDFLADGTTVLRCRSMDGNYTFYSMAGTKLFTTTGYEQFRGKAYLPIQSPDGTICVVDSAGTTLFTCSSKPDYLGADRFCMFKDEQYIMLDKTGAQLGAGYSFIGEFENGYAVVKAEGGTGYGLIDLQGNLVLPSTYTKINGVTSQGYVAVGDADDMCSVIDMAGNVIIPAMSDELITDEGSPVVFARNSSSYAIMTPGVTTTPDYKYTVTWSDPYFENGLLITRVTDSAWNSKYGLVDINGTEVLPCVYDTIQIGDDSDYIWVGNYTSDGDSIAYGVAKLDRTTTAPAVPVPEVLQPTATPTSYPVLVDGKPVAFDVYAMKDANGNDTNYFKLRDMASVLNGTSCQFNVGWDGAVNLTLGEAYVPNGTEMSAPFTGPQAVNDADAKTNVNGVATSLDTITLTDASGNGYTYYQLRALGDAVGFTVEWSAEAGIMINTK